MISDKPKALSGLSRLTIVALIALCPPTTHATLLRDLSVEELVANSDTIVVGTCEQTETVWLDKKIYTIATVRVSQSVKGQAAAGGTIKVYILGGRVREPLPVKLHVPGAARMAPGEEMVLFLETKGAKTRYHRFVGMRQGKVPVTVDPDTGRKSVHHRHSLKGGRMIAPARTRGPGDAKAEPRAGTRLEEFLAGIRRLAAEGQNAAPHKAATTKPAPPDTRRLAPPADGKGGEK